MKKILAMALLSMVFSSALYASCPTLDKVTFKCKVIGGKQYCNWTAPWWEGYAGTVEPGEHPTQFVEAFWRAGQDDPEVGSVNCFYRDRTGELVTLSQNSWGGVAAPADDQLWQDGSWPDKPFEGTVCTDSPEACEFQYG